MQKNQINCIGATIETLKNAFKNKLPITGIKAFLTHYDNHIDELLAIFMILRSDQGKTMFPEAEQAIGYKSNQELEEYELKGVEGFFEALSKGYLLIGTGLGILDEHGTSNKSTAAIIAEHLGITKNQRSRFLYSRLLNYVNYEDRNGSNFRNLFIDKDMAGTFSCALLADIIKNGNFAAQGNNVKLSSVAATAFEIMQIEIDSQALIFEGKEDYKNAKKQTIDLPVPKLGDKKLVLHVVESDHPAAVKHAKMVMKSKQFEALGILMMINSKGQFYICPNNGIDLTESTKVLRNTIARKRKMKTSYQELHVEGTIESSPELYIHMNEEGKIVGIMNGSLTQPDVKPLIGTVLTLNELIDSLLIGLDSDFFDWKHFKKCKDGFCSAQGKDGIYCSLKAAGLQRCHDIRKNNPVSQFKASENLQNFKKQLKKSVV